MKIRAYAAVSLLVCAASAEAQYANVIISGEIKPGVYGRVEIGNAPLPVLVYPEPVVIVRESRVGQPVYLHVLPDMPRSGASTVTRTTHAIDRWGTS